MAQTLSTTITRPVSSAAAPSVPARNIEVQVQGDVSGQLAVGDHIIQVGHVEAGSTVTIVAPDEKPQSRPRATPVFLRPRSFPGLLDRTADIRTVTGALKSAAPVEFYGPGGIGKTSLLRHLAHQPLDGAVPDGVVYFQVRREPVDDLLQSLYDAFYDSDAGFKPTDAEIRHALQGKRALVVLDDVELERDQVEALMNAAPGCTFLLASPERRLWGEGRAVALRGLPLEDAQALVEQELGRPLTSQEQPAFQSIHIALEGHPLRLLQVAATAREKGSALSDVAQRVQSGAPGEAWAAALLDSFSKPEGRVLVALAALNGAPLHADHVSALTGLSDAAAILKALQARGVVQAHSPRYTLAGTLERDLRQALDLTPWTERALAYFTDWTERQRSDWERLLEDAEAILHLLEWAAETGRWSGLLRLGRAIEGALALGKRWGAWARVLEWMFQAARALGDHAVEAWTLHQSGTRALCLGNVSTARTDLIQALRIREALGDRSGAAVTRHNLEILMNPPAPPTSGSGPGPVSPAAPGIPFLKLFALILTLGVVSVGGWLLLNGVSAPVPVFTRTPTPTWVAMATPTPTNTPPPTETPTPTATETPTSTTTPTATATETLTPTPTATSWPCGNVPSYWERYIVQRGDTPYALARRHSTTVDLIVCYNRLTDQIKDGQIIYLPPLPPTVTAPPPTTPPPTTPPPTTPPPTTPPPTTPPPTTPPPTPLPDLVVYKFSGPSTARPGEDIGGRMRLVITNRGEIEAKDYFLDVVLSRDKIITLSDQLLIGGREYGPAVAPGELAVVDLTRKLIPEDWPAGDAHIGVILDPFDHQKESDENNNIGLFPISLATSLPPPTAPSNLRYDRVGCSTVVIVWDDNAENEDGYLVYRDGSPIATLAPDTTFFTDETATTAEFTYGVAAFNAGGQSDIIIIIVPETVC